MRSAFVFACVFLAAATSRAADDDEAKALELADRTETTGGQARDANFTAEGAAGYALQRDGASARRGRLSAAGRIDHRLADDWRAIFADRLDLTWTNALAHGDSVNTLKEAYLSWQIRPDRIADAGRVNTRYGVAAAYNPTDYFRAGALRSIVSIDPAVLRENRLGAVMVRAQALWSTGSVTVHDAPRLADGPNAAAFSPDLGATNQRNRWLMVVSQKLSNELNPQWLVFGESGRAVQLGVNLTALVGDAVSSYLECSGGQSPSLSAQAGLRPDDSSWRARCAAGFTYTTPTKLSLTAEYQFDGAAADRTDWRSLMTGRPADALRYRQVADRNQDPPTQRRVFLRAAWQDALVGHLDLTSNFYVDAIDRSRQWWAEARYRARRHDIALQFRRQGGTAGSDYGAGAERLAWWLLISLYL